MSWGVVLTDRARRDLRRLDRTVAARVVEAIERFAADGTGDVTRLRGSQESRLRVGDWRVRIQFDHGERRIEVLRILPRGRAYR